MIIREIKSNSDESDPRPWADFDVTDGSLDVEVRAFNGVLGFREAMARREGRELPAETRQALAAKRRPTPTRHAFGLAQGSRPAPTPDDPAAEADLSTEIHALVVDLDGELQLAPVSQLPAVLYAHLAFYDPATGEWDRLQFVEAAP